MKKAKKWMALGVVACLLGGLCLTNVLAADSTAIYAAYREILEYNQRIVPSDTITYTLYDVDKNGIPELIARETSNNFYYVYTFSENKAIYCGNMSSSYRNCLYEHDGNGIIIRSGTEIVEKYTLTGARFKLEDYMMEDGVSEAEVMDYLQNYVQIREYSLADDTQLLKNALGIWDEEEINQDIDNAQYFYAPYEKVFSENCDTYYYLCDINQDGIYELLSGQGGSCLSCFYGLNEGKVVQYNAAVNDIKGVYEKDNALYVLEGHLSGILGEYPDEIIASEIELFKFTLNGDKLTKETIYHKEHHEKRTSNDTMNIPKIVNTLQGAKEIKMHSTKDPSALQAAEPIRVYLNGEALSLCQPPILRDGSTVVPMRAIFEALGASVTYEGRTKKIVAEKNGTKIELWVGKTDATINGGSKTLSTAVINQNGSAMVPLRFVSEALGAEILWNGTNKTVFITQ